MVAGGCCKLRARLILDEIHAVVGDKRGAHLALSIERLEHLTRNFGIGISDFGFRSIRNRSNRTTKSCLEHKIRNPKSEIRNLLPWFASDSQRRSVRLKKSRDFLLAPQTSILGSSPDCAIIDSGHARRSISRSNCPSHRCRPSCRAKFGTKFTTGWRNSFASINDTGFR